VTPDGQPLICLNNSLVGGRSFRRTSEPEAGAEWLTDVVRTAVRHQFLSKNGAERIGNTCLCQCYRGAIARNPRWFETAARRAQRNIYDLQFGAQAIFLATPV